MPLGVDEYLQLAVEHGVALDKPKAPVHVHIAVVNTVVATLLLCVPCKVFLLLFLLLLLLLFEVELGEEDAHGRSAARVQRAVDVQLLALGEADLAAGLDGELGAPCDHHVVVGHVRTGVASQHHMLVD